MAGKIKWLDKASMAATLIAAIGAAVAGFFTTTLKKPKLEILEPIRVERTYISELKELSEELTRVKAQMDSLTKLPKTASVSAKIAEIESRLSAFDKKIDVLNRVILQSPEKALEIPMLKRDIASLQVQYENATKSLEREISRAYETIKWVIGTIVLGILALAASAFLKGKTG